MNDVEEGGGGGKKKLSFGSPSLFLSEKINEWGKHDGASPGVAIS